MMVKSIDEIETVLRLKLILLSGYSIGIKKGLLEFCENKKLSLARVINKDNIYSFPWIFIRLNPSMRVRLVVDQISPNFYIELSDQNKDLYAIVDNFTNHTIVTNLELEYAMHHCPQQLFYNLHQYCFMKCGFCPLTIAPQWNNESLEKIFSDIDKFEGQNIHGIGLTSGIPAHESGNKVAWEMVRIVEALRIKIGNNIPIGVSPLQPSEDVIWALKNAKANEIRINIEVNNPVLARIISPRKNPEKTLESISNAVKIFGHGKVSSNIILGVGETNNEVIEGIEELAKNGAIATLSPYDDFPEGNKFLSEIQKTAPFSLEGRNFGRPKPDRLLLLAQEHKRILENHSLNPLLLKTMCPHCTATNIMPGRDL